MSRAPVWLDDLSFVAAPGRAVDGPPWRHMGLSRADGAGLLVDDGRDDEMAERHRLLAERRAEVLASEPEAAPANREVRALVEAWWCSTFGRPAPNPPGIEPLEAAGRLVQEDLCVLVPGADGLRLAAGCVCFPSHWRLADKLGQSVAAIHSPVPRYDVELQARVDRLLARLRPGVVVQRRNWTVHDRSDRFAPLPPAPGQRTALTSAADVGTRRWLRSELQTLRRLPTSGAVLFTIKTQRVPFAALSERPDVMRALAARLRTQPEALTAASGIASDLPLVLDWLDRAGHQPPTGEEEVLR